MAIKGKPRSRGGGGRRVATAPRPQPVIPKKPLLRRTAVRITALVVLVAGIVTVVLVALASQRADDRRERQREAVASAGVRIEGAIEGVAQPQPPAGVLILPELGQAFGELQAENPKVGRLGKQSGTWAEDLEKAATEMGSITTQNADLREAKQDMQQGLQLFASIVRTFRVGVGLEEGDRNDVLEPIGQQLTLAQSVFQAGWDGYQAVRREVGLPTPQTAPPPGGLPPGVPGLPPGAPPGVPPGAPPGVPPGAPPGG